MNALLAGLGEELKPCPICNGRAKRLTNQHGGYIECIQCGLRTRDRKKKKQSVLMIRGIKELRPQNRKASANIIQQAKDCH